MSSKTETLERTSAATIGETAGMIWTFLDSQHSEVPTSKLLREMDASRDTVQRAIGWLAREDKIVLSKSGSSETIRLR